MTETQKQTGPSIVMRRDPSGKWTVVVSASMKEPLTRRDLTHLKRALDVKLGEHFRLLSRHYRTSRKQETQNVKA